MGSRRDIKQFTDYIENCAENGTCVDITKLINLYKRTHPLLHTMDDNIIDWGAWSYALRRLPLSSLDMSVSTFWKLCVNIDIYTKLPKSNDYPQLNSKQPETWIENPSAGGYDYWLYSFTCKLKQSRSNVVISRGGYTDVFQIISLLCIHIIESEKFIRLSNTIQEKTVTDFLNLFNMITINKHYFQKGHNKDVLLKLCDKHDRLNLCFLVSKTVNVDWENTHVTTHWTTELKRKFANFMSPGTCEQSLNQQIKDNKFSVDILQVGMDNIYMRLFVKQIHILKFMIDEWAKQHKITTFYEKYYQSHKGWYNTSDTAGYAKIAKFCKSSKYLKFCKSYWPQQIGIDDNFSENIAYGIEKHVIELKQHDTCHTSSNQLVVYFVDIYKISNNIYYDTSLRFPDNAHAKNRYIILINCVYGDQSGHAWKALTEAFGTSIHSATFIGKCGGLNSTKKHAKMNREQVIIAKGYPHFTDENASHLGIVRDARVNKKYLETYFKQETSHVPCIWYGDVVTVTNVIIQSQENLSEWERKGAVGCEMEGTYIWKYIHDAYIKKRLNKKFKFTGLYYISDLPLGNSEQKLYNEVVDLNEGQPIVYTLLRAALNNIFRKYSSSYKLPLLKMPATSPIEAFLSINN